MSIVPIEQHLVWALVGVDRHRDDPHGHIGKSAAYRILKYGSGEDFGYNVAEWQNWVDANPNTFVNSSHPTVEYWLDNLVGIFAAFDLDDDPNYMTEAQAYEKLKDYTGQDFGYDEDKWRLWFAVNKPEEITIFPPGYD